MIGKKRQLFYDFIEVLRDTLNTVEIKISYYFYERAYRNKYYREHPDCPKLTQKQKKEYINYYKSFGFKHVWTAAIEFIYAVTGDFDVRYVPSDLFNLYIDNPYDTNREYCQNKANQPDIFKDGPYPKTIVKRINGYYLDENNKRIDISEAVKIIMEQQDEIVVKHATGGGGIGISFVSPKSVDEALLNNISYDFIIQRKIIQSPELAKFNETSVNIIKFTSYMYKGKVHILSSRLWVGGKDLRLSNTAGVEGYEVKINDDGCLYEKSLNNKDKRADGVPFKDIKLNFYKDCVEIIKKGHERLLDFPFISWDFTCDEKENTILIEYNLKWHVLYDIQTLTGPAFGDITDEVLKDAAKRREKSKSLLLK